MAYKFFKMFSVFKMLYCLNIQYNLVECFAAHLHIRIYFVVVNLGVATPPRGQDKFEVLQDHNRK